MLEPLLGEHGKRSLFKNRRNEIMSVDARSADGNKQISLPDQTAVNHRPLNLLFAVALFPDVCTAARLRDMLQCHIFHNGSHFRLHS